MFQSLNQAFLACLRLFLQFRLGYARLTLSRDRRYCRRRAGVCSRPYPAGAGPAGARRYLEERLRCPAGNLEAAAARSSCAGVGSGWFFFLQHSTPSGPDAAL